MSENETVFDNNSVKLLLETSKSEYDNEHNRTTIIDSKTSIALPIISAYALALAQLNNYKLLFAISVERFADLIIALLLFVTYTASLILALVAVIMMVKVISMRNYSVIKVRDLYDNNYLTQNEVYFSIKLVQLYISATENNKTTNDSRIPLYKKGWIVTVVSIILFVIFLIVNNYIFS